MSHFDTPIKANIQHCRNVKRRGKAGRTRLKGPGKKPPKHCGRKMEKKK